MADQSIEQTSYNRNSYRALQRLRARGAEYGIEIPRLQYPLTPDHSGGLALKVMTILSAALILAATGLLIWGVAKLMVPMLDVIQSTADFVDSIKNIPIINALGSIPALLVWAVIILILGGAVAIIASLSVFLYNLIRINCLTMQEKAAGYYLSANKTSALVTGIVLTILAVVTLIFVNVLVGLLFLCAGAYALALFSVLQHTRKQAKEAFAQLPKEQQEDFLAHNRALTKLRSRRAMHKLLDIDDWRKMGKFGWIFAMLDGFLEAREVYSNLKKSEEFRPVSTGLARRALWKLLSFTLTSVIIALAFYWVVNFIFVGIDFFIIIGYIVLFLVLVEEFLINLPQILNYNIKQLRLNKKPLGYIALALTLAMVAAVVVAIILVIGAIK